MTRTSSLDFFGVLNWIDGTPLLDHVEPYRRAIFTEALDTHDADGAVRHNLILTGRAKKNWKSADLVCAGLFCLLANDSPAGAPCYLLANDEGQAGDDLSLAKRLVAANPHVLGERLRVRQKMIERRDGRGFLEILPAQDVAGTHGKTYRFCGFDEIHAYRSWDLLEAMQLDPTRPDAQQWITSYASIYHRPGVPLFDLVAQAKRGADPRMLFSWYAADFTTDPDSASADPETRANPSRGSWADAGYLDQQRRRLPAHKFRRLHLNLPGLPEGSAFQPEPVMDAIARGMKDRPREDGIAYVGFVDMSGGSSDDAVVAIAHADADGRAVLDHVENQGPEPPFDPRLAVDRFAATLKRYGVARVTGDRYAGETFRADFARYGIEYDVATLTMSQLYEALEAPLNGRRVVLLDVPEVEQQLLGLAWRGGKIDHASGEHDDWANAAAGALVSVAALPRCDWCDEPSCSGFHVGTLGAPSRYRRLAPPAPPSDPFADCIESEWAEPPADPTEPVAVGIARDGSEAAAVGIARVDGAATLLVVRHAVGGAAAVAAAVKTWRGEFDIRVVADDRTHDAVSSHGTLNALREARGIVLYGGPLWDRRTLRTALALASVAARALPITETAR